MSRVFIGKLPHDVRESDIEKFLRGYGRIREISLKRGYGFVEFEDSRDAEEAIDDLHNKTLLGERVCMEHAHGRKREGGYGGDRYGGGGRGGFGRGPRGGGKYGPPVRTEFRVCVENLSSRTSWQDLKDYLRQAGKVTYADAHKQRVGEGIVEFASYDDMKNAIRKLNDTDLNGRNIRITEERASSRSRSRSRSRSPKRRLRSRSRSRSPKRRQRSRSYSRSKSRSHSPAKQRERYSRSRSRSPARQREQDSRSPSRSPAKNRGKGSRSRSQSPVKQRDQDSGRSKSRSRTPSPRKSRSRSRSPVKERSASPEPEN